MKKNIIFIVIAFFASSLTFAGGFQVSLHSAQNVGMGLVGTSLSSSPSCIFYNPGALSFVPGVVNVSFGANFMMPTTKFSDTTGYSAKSKFSVDYPFYLYASVNFLKRFAFGIGAYTPFGSATTWDNDWKGRYIIQKASLTAIYLQPTISVKFWKIGIGAGLVYSIGLLEQDIALEFKKFIPNSPDGQLIVKGKDYRGLGYNVGILFQPIKRLSIGISYRSKVTMKFKDGDATFSNIPVAFSALFPASNKMSTDIPLPANLNMGVHFMITDNWLIGVQADYTFWNVYDTTYIDFQTNTAFLADQKVANKYKNNWAFRIGSEYKYKMLSFRIGGYFDITPIPSNQVHPQDPGNSHYGITAGLSIRPIKFISIDIAYLYFHAIERTTTFKPLGIPATSYPSYGFKGSYVSSGHSPSIGISIHL